ncbi:unnamed protein product [Didymodactylos carnosus]|uniref:Uncharacterized protein n=1 Tax=Didymodactylos carnosus TaxID=1234261 RepID=A0A8S2EP56_9BILA|nr:unnamed protein product [Didymodactylos carnosus]CAF4031434.1 unnamed protein product [Didymodactylos carnosus]
MASPFPASIRVGYDAYEQYRQAAGVAYDPDYLPVLNELLVAAQQAPSNSLVNRFLIQPLAQEQSRPPLAVHTPLLLEFNLVYNLNPSTERLVTIRVRVLPRDSDELQAFLNVQPNPFPENVIPVSFSAYETFSTARPTSGSGLLAAINSLLTSPTFNVPITLPINYQLKVNNSFPLFSNPSLTSGVKEAIFTLIYIEHGVRAERDVTLQIFVQPITDLEIGVTLADYQPGFPVRQDVTFKQMNDFLQADRTNSTSFFNQLNLLLAKSIALDSRFSVFTGIGAYAPQVPSLAIEGPGQMVRFWLTFSGQYREVAIELNVGAPTISDLHEQFLLIANPFPQSPTSVTYVAYETFVDSRPISAAIFLTGLNRLLAGTPITLPFQTSLRIDQQTIPALTEEAEIRIDITVSPPEDAEVLALSQHNLPSAISVSFSAYAQFAQKEITNSTILANVLQELVRDHTPGFVLSLGEGAQFVLEPTPGSQPPASVGTKQLTFTRRYGTATKQIALVVTVRPKTTTELMLEIDLSNYQVSPILTDREYGQMRNEFMAFATNVDLSTVGLFLQKYFLKKMNLNFPSATGQWGS